MASKHPNDPRRDLAKKCHAERVSPLNDILTAWQAGKISYRQALELTGIDNLFDLYQAAISSDVKIRTTLLPREQRISDEVTAAIKATQTWQAIALEYMPEDHRRMIEKAVDNLAEYDPESFEVIKDMARDTRPTNHVTPDIQTWTDEKLLRCTACGWIHYEAEPSDKALDSCFRCGGEAFEPIPSEAAPRGVTILPLRIR